MIRPPDISSRSASPAKTPATATIAWALTGLAELAMPFDEALTFGCERA